MTAKSAYNRSARGRDAGRASRGPVLANPYVNGGGSRPFRLLSRGATTGPPAPGHSVVGGFRPGPLWAYALFVRPPGGIGPGGGVFELALPLLDRLRGHPLSVEGAVELLADCPQDRVVALFCHLPFGNELETGAALERSPQASGLLYPGDLRFDLGADGPPLFELHQGLVERLSVGRTGAATLHTPRRSRSQVTARTTSSHNTKSSSGNRRRDPPIPRNRTRPNQRG